MKNVIEEATRRLQQLQDAGIAVPGTSAIAAEPAPAVIAEEPIPQRAARTAHARARGRMSADAIERREPFIAEERTPPANMRTIDLGRMQAAGFITPSVAASKLLHEFRVIKRPLIQNALGRGAAPIKHGNLIMVTSSLPGEGKSFVSVNLAMSIAMEVDCRVLLVDADVIKPSVPKVLGLPPAPGLMDLLTKPEVSFGDVLLKTNVPRLDVLLAGSPHPESSELLASTAMTRLLQDMSARYPDRIIIFDSPPLLATTESRVLATHMGQVVLVVEAERTTHAVLESALATVESCQVVMTMLNKAPQSESGSYYGYNGYGQ